MLHVKFQAMSPDVSLSFHYSAIGSDLTHFHKIIKMLFFFSGNLLVFTIYLGVNAKKDVFKKYRSIMF